MNIFAYHFGCTGVAWYRVWQPMKYLARRGFDISRLPNESDKVEIPMERGKSNFPGISNHYEIAVESDIVFSQYRTPRKDAFRLVNQAQLCRVVIDVDDDLYNMDPSNPNTKHWERQPDEIEELTPGQENSPRIIQALSREEGVIEEHEGKKYFVIPGEDKKENVETQIKYAHAVTVTTETLKNRYRHLNKNIHVIPNAVDFELWEPKENDTDQFRIGLFGSNTHYRDWKEAVDGIKRFLAEYPKAVLVTNATLIVLNEHQGERFETAKSVPRFYDYLEDLFKAERMELHKPAEVEKYPAWLADKKCDVILAPLAHTAFNQGKSNIKYLEAAALRIPTIVSDEITYNQDIKHGVNGLIAKKPSDWYVCLKRLYENAQERRAMGNRAWMDVKNRYDMALIAEKYERLFISLVREGENEILDRNKSLVAV